MRKTANYDLCQWDPEDRILREDFNSDNEKIDAAIADAGFLAKLLDVTTQEPSWTWTSAAFSWTGMPSCWFGLCCG